MSNKEYWVIHSACTEWLLCESEVRAWVLTGTTHSAQWSIKLVCVTVQGLSTAAGSYYTPLNLLSHGPLVLFTSLVIPMGFKLAGQLLSLYPEGCLVAVIGNAKKQYTPRWEFLILIILLLTSERGYLSFLSKALAILPFSTIGVAKISVYFKNPHWSSVFSESVHLK